MPHAFARVLLFPCAAAMLVAARAERPKAEARAGQKIERTFVHQDKGVLAAVELRVDGEPHDAGAAAKGMLETASEDRMVFEDTIVEADQGRATRLRRRFGELESSTKLTARNGDKEKESEEPRKSPFAGLEVEFTRDPKSDEWKRAWVGSGADDELLEGLQAEVDFASWLPPREVEEGDTWKLSAGVYARTVLRPAGHLRFDTDPPAPAKQKELQEELFGAFTGELVATWKGTREVDGKRVGVIAVAGEVASEADIEVENPGGSGGTAKLGVSLHEEIEAELLWDLEGRRARSLELSTKGTHTRTESGKRKMQEREVEIEREMRFDTEDTWKVSFEES
jgi:hypothetical protein